MLATLLAASKAPTRCPEPPALSPVYGPLWNMSRTFAGEPLGKLRRAGLRRTLRAPRRAAQLLIIPIAPFGLEARLMRIPRSARVSFLLENDSAWSSPQASSQTLEPLALSMSLQRILEHVKHVRRRAIVQPGRRELLDRVRDATRLRHHSHSTEQTYVYCVRPHILFHGKRRPRSVARAVSYCCRSDRFVSIRTRPP